MTFEQYVAYAGTPENLAREAGWWLGRQRHDFSGLLLDWYTRARLDEPQVAAIRWLAAQPGGRERARDLGGVVVGLPKGHSRAGAPGRGGRP